MKEINTTKPIFIIGAPKAGTTSLHIELTKNKEFNFSDLKDTHLLQRKDFDIRTYSSFFKNNNKRIIEVDQNMAIHEIAFKNINKYFSSPTFIYIVRDPEKRFFSAYKWLKKMGMVKTLDEALGKYRKFLIDQGNYFENIKNNIIPNFNSPKIYLVKFEDLIQKDGETLSSLKELLGMKDFIKTPLLVHNESKKPRFSRLLLLLKIIYRPFKYRLPNKINSLIKTSKHIEKLLFTNKDFKIDESEIDISRRFSKSFNLINKKLEDLEFINGIVQVNYEDI